MISSNLALNDAILSQPFQSNEPPQENWLDGDHRSVDLSCSALLDNDAKASKVEHINNLPWQWPEKPVVFIADPHADAQAFEASLVASGGIEHIDANTISLSPFGKSALFVIGGDCLDKGPSNLALLDSIRKLIQSGAQLKILAGNHDVRLLMGLNCLRQQDNVLTSHMFLRMGAKIVPLLQEVFDLYVKPNFTRENLPSAEECELFLFPHKDWFEAFPILASRKMSARAIDKEVNRLKEKIEEFKSAALICGMDIQALYATAQMCERLFLDADGQYAWFFEAMSLAHCEGSFLFIHAGLDDEMACLVASHGLDHVNDLYLKQISFDMFEFYYGAVANTLRTKYRADDDFRLTNYGVNKLFDTGIHAVVHGHQNRHHGQRMVLRENLLHFECDTTLDQNSRIKEGLSGHGFGVTLLLPEGKALGISSDYSQHKCFNPSK